ncbi:MAG TPA: hypothetical protein VIM58_12235, partial [Candidatus Methylacidiphilales bacterium]
MAVLVVMISRVGAAAAKSTQEAKRRADNFTKARSALDLFATDVKAGLFRADLAAFKDSGGADAISFYTLRPALGTGVRNVSLVSYWLDAVRARLERGSLPLQWDGAAGLISFNNTASLPAVSQASGEDVADGILRVRLSFIDAAGNLSHSYSANSRTVGITLVVVDAETLALLQPGQLARLTSPQGAFPDDSRDRPAETLQAYWEGKEKAGGFFDGYPAPLRSGLRIFERYVALPKN